MKVHRPLLSKFVAVAALAAWMQTSFAANEASVSPPTDQPPPMKMLVFTAGAVLGEGYKTFKTSGGTGNIVYALYDEKGEKEVHLPAELTFGADGVVRGTVPTAQNTSTTIYTIKAFDEGGGVASKKVGFKINPPLTVIAEPIRLTAGGNIVMPIYPFKISGGTGRIEIIFMNKEGTTTRTPSGLVFGKEGGVTGKVPESTAELDGMQARIVDEGGGVVVRNMSWVISPPMTAIVNNPTVTAGGEVPRDLIPVRVTGGTNMVKLAIFESDGVTPAALPEGVVFNDIDGSLAGRVNMREAIEKHYIVKAVDQGGGLLESKFTLKINKPLEFSELR